MDVKTAARQFLDTGLSILPIRADGSKAPAVSEWRQFMERPMSFEEIDGLFGSGVGIGIVCGQVSGKLEVLDFDRAELFSPWRDLVEAESPGLIDRLPCVMTPRPGFHLYYRCVVIGGSQKLAVEPSIDEKTGKPGYKTGIESRGEGSYVVTFPSPSACHPTGRRYEHTGGPPLTEIPTITVDEREILLRLARAFDLRPAKIVAEPGPGKSTGSNGRLRPGDDFNQRGQWEDILRPHGWEPVRERAGVIHWRRPGKEAGVSATTGFCKTPEGVDLFYNFSSNGHPFEPMVAYTKFSVFTLLNHSGDYSAAARDLSGKGYGDPLGFADAGGEHLSDLGNSRRLVSAHGERLRYCHTRGKWLVWDGRRWTWDETGGVERFAKETVRTIYAEAGAKLDGSAREGIAKHALRTEAEARIKSMIALATSEPGISVRNEDLDTDPWALNCLNGTLDLRTAELRPHRREDMLTNLVPVEYNPAAMCPTWDSFLEIIMAGNPVLIDYLRRVVGYGLTGDVREDALFFLYGTGANGKTTLLNAIRDVVGHDYASEIDPDILIVKKYASHPTGLADLFGKRFVSTVEVEDGQRLAEVLVKRLTGRDQISARRMREDFWRFSPTHKLFLAANHKPVIKGTDYGIWRRLRLIPFNVTIPRAEQDRTLSEKLRAEREGILAWIVRGAVEWFRGGLQDPPEVLAATEEYRDESDTLADFFADCCIMNDGDRASAAGLYEAYIKWQKRAEGGEPMTQTLFGRRLQERGLIRKRGTGGCVFWYGIRMRDDLFAGEENGHRGDAMAEYKD